jgi:tricarballylate dehydrogenase
MNDGVPPAPFDVLVLGGGLSGLAAAASAAEAGARALVVERAPTIGGSSAISGGYVWTIADVAGLRHEDQGEFQRHGHLVVNGYRDAVRWLSGFCPPLLGEQPSLSGRGPKFDMGLLLMFLTQAVGAAGGDVWTGAELMDVTVAAGGYVARLAVDGERRTVRAASLVLATGGRQASVDVRRSLVDGDVLMPLRGNPCSRGDGAAVASALGGSVNVRNRGFYGHLFPAGVTPVSPVDFIAFALYHSAESLLLDRSGRRFTDESRGDHNNAVALARHGGRGLLLWSRDVQERAAGAPFVGGSPQVDRWAFARDRGGRVAYGEDLGELVPALRDWGYEVDGVSPPGLGAVFAAEVVPAITYTFGGIEVDDDGSAIDRNGDPIPGLYAAGADMSDIYHEGYGGGLCAAVTTGRRAGHLAAEVGRHVPG